MRGRKKGVFLRLGEEVPLPEPLPLARDRYQLLDKLAAANVLREIPLTVSLDDILFSFLPVTNLERVLQNNERIRHASRPSQG